MTVDVGYGHDDALFWMDLTVYSWLVQICQCE